MTYAEQYREPDEIVYEMGEDGRMLYVDESSRHSLESIARKILALDTVVRSKFIVDLVHRANDMLLREQEEAAEKNPIALAPIHGEGCTCVFIGKALWEDHTEQGCPAGTLGDLG